MEADEKEIESYVYPEFPLSFSNNHQINKIDVDAHRFYEHLSETVCSLFEALNDDDDQKLINAEIEEITSCVR